MTTIVILLIPLIVLTLASAYFCLKDLYQPDRKVRGGNKTTWALIILLTGFLGRVIYFQYGRLDE